MAATGEQVRLIGVEGDHLTFVFSPDPIPRSRWWMTRLWIAKRISGLAYRVWPE